MENYIITKKDLKKWCTVPFENLANHPERKMDLDIDAIEKIGPKIANILLEEVVSNNEKGLPTRWVLPGGHPELYGMFAKRVNNEKISLANVHVIHMDTWLDWQYRPFPKSNVRFSCEAKMEMNLYNKIDDELNVPKNQRYYPDPLKPDLYDEKIDELGGLDTVVGGVGCKGLVAFNEEPKSNFYKISIDEFANSKSRIVKLNDDTITAYAQREFGTCFDVLPPNAFTIGMKSMLKAKRALFIVTTGEWKNTVVRVALFSKPTIEYPVTLFPHFVEHCKIFADAKTADHVLCKNKYVNEIFGSEGE